jgi:hypothetical protein
MPKNTNVNIFKFRVIVDTEKDVFRDIEIETDATFEAFHKAVLDAFDFEEGEMASFYMSNESWEKGLEIALMDVGGATPSHGQYQVGRHAIQTIGQSVVCVRFFAHVDFLRGNW